MLSLFCDNDIFFYLGIAQLIYYVCSAMVFNTLYVSFTYRTQMHVMAENIMTSTAATATPIITDETFKPKGVFGKPVKIH